MRRLPPPKLTVIIPRPENITPEIDSNEETTTAITNPATLAEIAIPLNVKMTITEARPFLKVGMTIETNGGDGRAGTATINSFIGTIYCVNHYKKDYGFYITHPYRDGWRCSFCAESKIGTKNSWFIIWKDNKETYIKILTLPPNEKPKLENVAPNIDDRKKTTAISIPEPATLAQITNATKPIIPVFEYSGYVAKRGASFTNNIETFGVEVISGSFGSLQLALILKLFFGSDLLFALLSTSSITLFIGGTILFILYWFTYKSNKKEFKSNICLRVEAAINKRVKQLNSNLRNAKTLIANEARGIDFDEEAKTEILKCILNTRATLKKIIEEYQDLSVALEDVARAEKSYNPGAASETGSMLSAQIAVQRHEIEMKLKDLLERLDD